MEINESNKQLPYVAYRHDGSIVTGVYRKNLTIDLATAKEIVAERLKIFDGKSYPVLIDVGGIRSATKEARDYLAQGEAIKGVNAMAILVKSELTVIMANLFIFFSKPQVPTKVFKTKEQATQWLAQFVTS